MKTNELGAAWKSYVRVPRPTRVFAVGLLVLIAAAGGSAYGQFPGDKLWEFETQGEVHSAPAVSTDGTIYFGSRDGNLYALTPSGKQKWLFQTAGYVDAAPAIGPDGTVYVGSLDGVFYAVSPEGKLKWSVPTGGAISEPAAIAADGTLYFVSGDGILYAVNSNGSANWRFKTGKIFSNQPSFPAPAVASDGTIYNGSEDYYINALNPDGTRRWRFPLYQSVGFGSGLPTFAKSSFVIDLDGNVYFKAETATSLSDPMLISLRPDGQKRSEFLDIGSGLPSLGEANVIYTANGAVLRAHFRDGSEKWIVALGSFALIWPDPTTPVVASDGSVYVNIYNTLYNVDSAGKEKWNFKADGPITTPLTLTTNGSVLFGSSNKKLYAVAGSAGLAKTAWPMYRRNPQHIGAASAPVFDQLALGVNMYAGLVINGKIGSTYRVESQDKLTDSWTPVATITLDRTPYLFFDIGSTNSTKRFYRAVQLP